MFWVLIWRISQAAKMKSATPPLALSRAIKLDRGQSSNWTCLA